MALDLPDRGSKHRCFQCQTLFYDLKRPKLVCPRCGADQADEAQLKPPAKKGRKPAAKPVPKPEPEAEEVGEAEGSDEAELPEPDDDEDDELEDVDGD